MDAITQGLLGATFGQAFFEHKLGKKALFWGAVGGIIPDLDFIPTAIMSDPMAPWLWHRGPSHALWFGPVVGTLIGFLMWRFYQRKLEGASDAPPVRGPNDPPHPGARSVLKWWIGLFIVAITTHPLLDVFTTYGTQLLSPFDDTRFVINAIGIIDPTYTLVLVLALLLGRNARQFPRRAHGAALAALLTTSAYLGYCALLNDTAEAEATRQLEEAEVSHQRVNAYPTLFQPWLRRIVVFRDDEVRVGYLSTWTITPIDWRSFDRLDEDPRVQALMNTREGEIFEWFAAGQVLPVVGEPDDEGAVHVKLADMRYGLASAEAPSMWGIEADVSADAEVLGTPQRYREPMEDVGAAWDRLWELTFPEEAP